MSANNQSVDDTLAAPLLGVLPEHDDGHFDTDGGESTGWTPSDSPRHMRVCSSGHATYSPFAAYREGNLGHLKAHSHTQRESRAR